MTAPARRVFVDTNVLIYASRPIEPASRQASDALAEAEDAGDELCISRQVLREYLSSVTRPQIAAAPLPAPVAIADVRRLIEIYAVLEDGPEVTERLLGLLLLAPTGGKQVHDANIAATMLAHSVTRLLTFNGADFQRFAGLIEVVVP